MKKDPYFDIDFRDIPLPNPMDRRDFLKKVGTGLIVAFTIKSYTFDLEGAPPQRQETDLNAYLKISENNRVSLFTGKIEMGQGVITSLALMLADELDVTPQQIDMIMGDTDLCPWDMGTFGSRTTRFFGPPLRAAGARARILLRKLAAEALSVGETSLMAEAGVVYVKGNRNKKVTYGELTKGKTILTKPDIKPVLKKPEEFRYMGTSATHRDAYEKVTGKAKYSGDIHLPGMVHTRILRPPSHFAKLINVDTSAAEKMEGVDVIKQGNDLIAVLHPSRDVVDRAIESIKAQYRFNEPEVNDQNIFEYLLEHVTGSNTVNSGGDIDTGKNLSRKILTKTYYDGYKAHAPIESHTAIATVEDGRLIIWASTQTPFRLQTQISRELDIEESKVHVKQVFLGGGFGGKSSNLQAVEAAKLAWISHKPVQVMWTREEEFFFDTYRPAAVVKITSGLDNSGKIAFWDYNVYYAGERGAAQFYDIPNHRTLSSGTDRGDPDPHPFGTGPWRAPANNTNTFARESHIDQLARLAGKDPVVFRLEHLKGNPKLAEVIRVAADKFGWTDEKRGNGKGYGMACGVDAGTWVAVMVEVEADQRTGHVQVKRAVCVQNMGLAVNPQGAIIQAEGCMIMGLGYALTEDIRFKGGKILTTNFDEYEFTHFNWTPELNVILIDAKDDPPQGGGEPAIICMGGAVANAIYDATGARLFQMPMNPDRIKKAIAAL